MSSKIRVLGVVGSPRKKGNTKAMVDAVLQGASMNGAGVELIQLSKEKIKTCRGCDTCREKGECVHDDDMQDILGLMKESDVWVLGTPVYWWGPTGQMKTFIDRWYQDMDGLRNCGKKKVILTIPYGDTNPKTAENLIGMFENALNYLKKDIFAVIEGPGMGGKDAAESNKELIEKCIEVGKKVVK